MQDKLEICRHRMHKLMQELKFVDNEIKDYRGSYVFFHRYEPDKDSKDGEGVLTKVPARATVQEFIKELKEKTAYGIDASVLQTFDNQERLLVKLIENLREAIKVFSDIDFYIKLETGKLTFEDKMKIINIRGDGT